MRALRTSRPAARAALWVGLFSGPLGWAANAGLGYVLASDVCRNRFAGLWWTAGIALLVAFAGLAPALLHLRSDGHGGDAPAEPWRFLAGVALGACSLFALVIVAQAASLAVFDGCERW